MYGVGKLNQGVSSLGNINKSLLRSGNNLLMCIVPKYLKVSWKNKGPFRFRSGN